ncbi:cobalt-precorrin 5A hydrolase [Anaerobacillus sp. MEB173]|uniref:cobalt-precorrin 5A hydrolase n=1 Tax=Anaerobacillus sp. MEB173 TaxID=3383345 RepID=UPI003F91372F
MEKIALVSITKHGVQMIRELQSLMPTADLFYMTKFSQGDEEERGITMFEGSVRKIIPQLFEQYDGITFVVSLGAVVRMIAPVLKDKKTDPAVVVIDDKGEFVISVLSGHLGGANELTRTIAKLLQATPVITTASDVQKTIAVDLLGRDFGWVIDGDEYVTPVSAAVVNEEPVVVIQESGERNWWKYSHPLPANIKCADSLEEAKDLDVNASLIITHRLFNFDFENKWLSNYVIYRPKSVYLGMGCNRGTSAEEIEQVIIDTLAELEISFFSVKGISTIDLKKDEQGMLDVCKKFGWDFVYYTPEQLNKVEIENPSETVFKYTGAYGVSEPAAKLSSGESKLLLEKKKSGNVTISVAVVVR